MKNSVFFSRAKKDAHSPRLLALLRNTPLKHEFCYYCVDPDPTTKKRNDDLLSLLDITKVPTMYVNGEKYVGEDAFLWVQAKMRQLQGAGGGERYVEDFAPGVGKSYDEPMYTGTGGGYGESTSYCPPQQQQQPGFQSGGMQGRPPMVPPQGMLPGVGHAPQMGGFAGMGLGGNGMRPPPPPGPMGPNGGGSALQGIGTAGSDGGGGGLMAGGADSSFADPFSPTDITGINSMGLSGDDLMRLLTPKQTKNDDGTAKSDDMLKRYMMERDADVPQAQSPNGGMQGGGMQGGMPGMRGMQMSQMAIPQMR